MVVEADSGAHKGRCCCHGEGLKFRSAPDESPSGDHGGAAEADRSCGRVMP